MSIPIATPANYGGSYDEHWVVEVEGFAVIDCEHEDDPKEAALQYADRLNSMFRQCVEDGIERVRKEAPHCRWTCVSAERASTRFRKEGSDG
jgi:hypothetical protein